MGLARPFDGLVRSRLFEVKTNFGPNFRREDRWITNSLKRLEGLVEPKYRPGSARTNAAHSDGIFTLLTDVICARPAPRILRPMSPSRPGNTA